jgi:uncharacterized protein
MVKIHVHVVANARRAGVEPLEGGGLRVAVTAAPHKGQANRAVIEALAEYFRVPRSRVRILLGRTARRKVVEIEG